MASRVERRTPRIEVQLPVELSVPGQSQPDQQAIYGQTLNVGAGGIAIESGQAVRVGDPVICHLHIDGSKAAFDGTVAWTEPGDPTQSSPRHNVGIEFDGVDEERKRALRNLIAAAQLGQQPVSLRFAGLEQHLQARATTHPDGIRLSASLTALAEGNHFAFDFERDGLRFEGTVREVTLQVIDGVPQIALDLAVDADHDLRGRKQTQYGWEDELSESRVRNVTLPMPYALHPNDEAPLGEDVNAWDEEDDEDAHQMYGDPLRAVPEKATGPSLQPQDLGPRRNKRRSPVTKAAFALLTLLGGGALALIVPEEPPRTRPPDLNTAQLQTESPAGGEGLATASSAVTTEGTDFTAPSQAPERTESVAPEAPSTAPTTNETVDLKRDVESGESAGASGTPGLTVEVAEDTLSVWVPMTGSLDGMRSHIWREPRAVAVQLPHGRILLPPGRHAVDTGSLGYVQVGQPGARTALKIPLKGTVSGHEVNRFNGGLEVQIRFSKR